MTLALLFFVISLTASQVPGPAQTQNPSNSSQSAPSASAATQNPSDTNAPGAVKRAHHKKKTISPDCNPSTAAPAASTGTAPASQTNSSSGGSSSGNASSASASSGNSPSNDSSSGKSPNGNSSPESSPSTATSTPASPAGNAPSASTKCPPTKTIVRQGGSSEPSIQLVGGPNGDPAAQQERNSANQLLESTEANLKKIAGQPLSSNQQDTVSQIRQFVEQSKTAVATGDMERARSLAWKAQLLSQELVKPQ